ncbi:MAG TPA: helix-turn-helix transcriptional regulator [Pyrinomonadaceae bacterium]|jgi:DNA-binding CsgD family transcriptional regulator|nr:helix-turn-helix transcriptional regulator [Pyrinomonadaceae bacterium]
MALLALSHTPLEDQVYQAMLSEVVRMERSGGNFSVRSLSHLTGINSSSTVRRALTGLLRKLSIESAKPKEGEGTRASNFYQIFKPEEIFERRRALGLLPYPKEIEAYSESTGFARAIERVVRNSNLSRREAQVALACVEGMTNIEIGQRLSIGEQTVKFHLRNIFTKFGVRRRTELISRLLVPDNHLRATDKENQGGASRSR